MSVFNMDIKNSNCDKDKLETLCDIFDLSRNIRVRFLQVMLYIRKHFI